MLHHGGEGVCIGGPVAPVVPDEVVVCAALHADPFAAYRAGGVRKSQAQCMVPDHARGVRFIRAGVARMQPCDGPGIKAVDHQ